LNGRQAALILPLAPAAAQPRTDKREPHVFELERYVMTDYHTRWARPEAQPGDPERIAIREALAFGKADGRCQTEMSLRQVHGGGYARSPWPGRAARSSPAGHLSLDCQ
jgi:hypothetical protein